MVCLLGCKINGTKNPQHAIMFNMSSTQLCLTRKLTSLLFYANFSPVIGFDLSAIITYTSGCP